MRTPTQRAAGSGTPMGWRTWLPLVGLAGAVWLAGCQTTEKPKEQAQERPAAATTEKPGAERSAPAQAGRPHTAQLRATDVPAQPSEGAPPPPPPQPRSAARTTPQSPPPGVSPGSQLTDVERDRMREYILQKLKEREAGGEAQPAEAEQPAPAPAPAETTAVSPTGASPSEMTYADAPAQQPLPPIRTEAQPAKPAQTPPPTAQQTGNTKQPAGKPAADAGCGQTTPGRLEAPAEGSPQPKYVCTNPKIELAEVWTGESPTFKFVIANEGEGALQIKLKKP